MSIQLLLVSLSMASLALESQSAYHEMQPQNAQLLSTPQHPVYHCEAKKWCKYQGRHFNAGTAVGSGSQSE